MAETIGISVRSRYKDTDVYSGTTEPEFGLFTEPEEFVEDDGSWKRHRVLPQDIGNLDALAVRYFGIGYEGLWWAIAMANAMINPEEEMVAGDVIVIPSRALAVKFIARAGKNV